MREPVAAVRAAMRSGVPSMASHAPRLRPDRSHEIARAVGRQSPIAPARAAVRRSRSTIATHRGARGPAKPFTADRGEGRPLPKPRSEGDRPWNGKPREQDRRAPSNEGRSEGRRPWTPKPRAEGERPWASKPGGRPPRPPKGGADTRYGQKPDYQNRGESKPREDRSRNDRPATAKGRDEGRRPWGDGSRSGDDRSGGARKPFGQQQGTGRWPAKPDQQNRSASGGHGPAKPFHGPKSGAGGWAGKPARKPWTPKPDRRDATSGPRPSSTDRPRREDWRTRPDRPPVPERPDGRREAAPEARARRPSRSSAVGGEDRHQAQAARTGIIDRVVASLAWYLFSSGGAIVLLSVAVGWALLTRRGGARRFAIAVALFYWIASTDIVPDTIRVAAGDGLPSAYPRRRGSRAHRGRAPGLRQPALSRLVRQPVGRSSTPSARRGSSKPLAYFICWMLTYILSSGGLATATDRNRPSGQTMAESVGDAWGAEGTHPGRNRVQNDTARGAGHQGDAVGTSRRPCRARDFTVSHAAFGRNIQGRRHRGHSGDRA